MITTTKKKDTVLCWQEIGSFFVVAGNFHYDRKKKIHNDREKKDTVVCLMGARFWRLRPEKKDTVICLLGARFWQIRPEKEKDTVVCLTGCAVVLFFVVAGNFYYDRKKRYSRLLAGNWQLFCCDGKFS